MIGGYCGVKGIRKIIRVWLEEPYIDEETKKELKLIKHDKREIEDRILQGIRIQDCRD